MHRLKTKLARKESELEETGQSMRATLRDERDACDRVKVKSDALERELGVTQGNLKTAQSGVTERDCFGWWSLKCNIFPH